MITYVNIYAISSMKEKSETGDKDIQKETLKPITKEDKELQEWEGGRARRRDSEYNSSIQQVYGPSCHI